MIRMAVQFGLAMIVSITAIFPGCSSAQSFNDLARREEKNSIDVIPLLNIHEGDTIADLGAGGGYYSVKLARAVGETGQVYAVDVNEESVAFIREYACQESIANVVPLLATFADSKLPAGSVDLIFIRNAYHDFGDRISYFIRLKSALKKKGRIVIIDYDPDKLGFFRRQFGHALSEQIIIEEMKKAGYRGVERHSELKEQSFNIFINDDDDDDG